MSTIKLRTRQSGKTTLLRILVDHPMETGRRRDDLTGQIIPAHFITDLTITHNDQTVIHGRLSTAISRNPFFSFELEGVKPGDILQVAWNDNLGLHDEAQIRITTNE
jgi:sulfur-oxidizing protein SoxZ